MEVMQTYKLPFLSETEKLIHSFYFTGMLAVYYYKFANTLHIWRNSL
jgi:hypothetical protein